jgi:hypothetical protein
VSIVVCRVLRVELAECREEVRRREVEVAAWHLKLNRIITEFMLPLFLET